MERWYGVPGLRMMVERGKIFLTRVPVHAFEISFDTPEKQRRAVALLELLVYGQGVETGNPEEIGWLETLEEQGLIYRGGSVWESVRKDLEFVLLWAPRPSEVVHQIEHQLQMYDWVA